MIKYFFTLSFIVLSTYTVKAEIHPLDPQNGFSPPSGKILMIIGQDKHTIDEYVNEINIIPAGVMVYTSIYQLEGLREPFNNGAGVHHAQYLIKKYPHSILQLGLYLVGALEGINAGTYDANIDQLAGYLKGINRPVYLRIGYEFDNKLNKYDPHLYRNAFRRIVNRFRVLGVENTAFVWHSDAQFADSRVDLMEWYPGDDYVDWIAVSLFAPSQYARIKEIAVMAAKKRKPFMIAEASPAGTYSARAKMDWYTKFFRIIDEIQPQAVSYINSDWESLPSYKGQSWGDARVQKFPEIKKLWLKELNKEKYIHAGGF